MRNDKDTWTKRPAEQGRLAPQVRYEAGWPFCGDGEYEGPNRVSSAVAKS